MSAAPEYDFEMHQGDTKYLAIEVVDGDGAAKSLAGVTSVRWWFAKKSSSAEPLIQKTVGTGIAIVGDPVEGNIMVTIDPVDTLTLKGPFYHELEVVDFAGDIATCLRGTMTVIRALIDNL